MQRMAWKLCRVWMDSEKCMDDVETVETVETV